MSLYDHPYGKEFGGRNTYNPNTWAGQENPQFEAVTRVTKQNPVSKTNKQIDKLPL